MDKELLGTLVAEAKDALETLEKQLVQAQEEYDEATKTAKRSNYICNELFTCLLYTSFYHIFPFWAGCDKGLFLCLCRYY